MSDTGKTKETPGAILPDPVGEDAFVRPAEEVEGAEGAGVEGEPPPGPGREGKRDDRAEDDGRR